MEVQNVTGAALHVQHGHVHWLKDRIGSALVTSRWCDGEDRVSSRKHGGVIIFTSAPI